MQSRQHQKDLTAIGRLWGLMGEPGKTPLWFFIPPMASKITHKKATDRQEQAEAGVEKESDIMNLRFLSDI